MPETRQAHPYFLYDAIQQQPERIEKVLSAARPRVEQAADAASAKKRLVFVGIGTSHHAAQVAERWTRLHSAGRAVAHAEQSFELVHYPLALGPDDAVVVITHTGTTTQSIEALRAAKSSGALTIAITGEGSGAGIDGADFHIETCEQEVAFAYTKSYTTALAVLAMLSLRIAERRGHLADPGAHAALARVPGWMRQALATETQIRALSKEVAAHDRLVFFGAGPGWPTSCEAALKIKESSYIAAEGFESEEILHGPFSQIDSHAAMVGLLAGAPADERARTILRAAGELKTLRLAITVPVANHDIAGEHVIEVPECPEWLLPFVHLVPLYLLTYFVALARGLNPDTGRQDQAPHASAHRVYKL